MLRIALILTSIANVAAGLGLGGLWFKFRNDAGMPIVVLFIALSLIVQGGYTLGHLRGIWKAWGLPSFSLFVTGESAAALVGASRSCRESSTISTPPTATMSGGR